MSIVRKKIVSLIRLFFNVTILNKTDQIKIQIVILLHVSIFCHILNDYALHYVK